ncbi:VOC family protein [Belliella pelovolcani]|jgi:catechol 2,3-dioxygenase-like lactoylglutathione lyase family enzyme|uniref:Catechol 2,3-dioxygenase n=1 Tax=Belliella pelovolcani TaxID=529505 RepID=A0A1N7P612_9BACT|nr:VOC family protein [Belliella pelovolcani]SIT05988.1 Catechol 2,3-dioxygenase [Belliella pelovolcani]
MKQRIAQFSLLVKDYDEAIAFYTQKLGFKLLEDTQISENKRWVRIIPPGSTEESCGILLAKAANGQQEIAVGNQSGGRVFLFLHTDDFERDYQNLLDQKIKIFRERSEEDFGKVVVFEDLYGNLWDLIEPKQ